MSGTSQGQGAGVSKSSFAATDVEELGEIYRYWAGETGVPTGDPVLVRQELLRAMSNERRVFQRYQELGSHARDLLVWVLGRKDAFVTRTELEESAQDLPVPALKRGQVVIALTRRGFLCEEREKEWLHYDDVVYRVPEEMAGVLREVLGDRERDLEAQLLLRAFVRTQRRPELVEKLTRVGRPAALAEDPSALVSELSQPERIEASLGRIRNATLRELLRKALDDHGGIFESRHLERLDVELPAELRSEVEGCLLGTTTDGELSDLGLRLGPRSLVLFHELTRSWIEARLESSPQEEPEPAADALADLAAIRSYLDHNSVRVTREGSLYRSTARKMASVVLTPGSRPGTPDEALNFLLAFLQDAGLVRTDEKGRLRVKPDWRRFDARGPVEQSELLLTYVLNDVRDVPGGFHQPRLRQLLLTLLREHASQGWLDLRSLAHLARNRFYTSLEREETAERYSKRYKYAALPALIGPGGLSSELVSFARNALHRLGAVSVAEDASGRELIRVTRMGAALLGIESPDEESDGALIVTGDFEIILFPETGGIELVHEIARFARREKADYSLHYRIDQDSVMEAVAGGTDADAILATLEANSRHELPENVVGTIRGWAAQVRPLEVRRALLLRTENEEQMEALLRMKEIKEVAGERLNPTTVEIFEDPTVQRIAGALKSSGFYLR